MLKGGKGKRGRKRTVAKTTPYLEKEKQRPDTSPKKNGKKFRRTSASHPIYRWHKLKKGGDITEFPVTPWAKKQKKKTICRTAKYTNPKNGGAPRASKGRKKKREKGHELSPITIHRLSSPMKKKE